MSKYLTLGLLIIGIISGCNLRKKVESEPVKTELDCDSSITYSNTIKNIFDARCVKCHGGNLPKSGIDLSSYEMASKVTNHRLVCVVSWGDNCTNMPPSEKQLTSTEIQQIQCWLDNGVKN